MNAPALLLLCAAAAVPPPSSAPSPEPPPPAGRIVLARAVEDGKPMLVATVSRDGRPAAGVAVRFSAVRSFGEIILGADTTLEDGTAAVPFPATLPGEKDGLLNVRAVVTDPEPDRGAEADARLPALRARVPAENSGRAARALWAPHAPYPLIVTLLALLCGVWLTYAIVIFIFIRIAKEVPHESSE